MQKKNNWGLARRDYYALPQAEIQLDRRKPGAGYRHLLTIEQLRAFLDLLPDWEEIAVGLNAVVLGTRDDPSVLGWHLPGVVEICAWERELWSVADLSFMASGLELIELLQVKVRSLPGDRYELRWTEAQARAFQLLDVLPHELGHHHDRITSRRERRASRGEPYAERYAASVRELVWPAYIRAFSV